MQEQMEKQKKEQAESKRLALEAKKEAHRQAVMSSLPSEPEGNQVLKVRVRLPSGKVLERRFQPETPLQILLNYLIVEGYPTDEYKVLSTWPRRDVSILIKIYKQVGPNWTGEIPKKILAGRCKQNLELSCKVCIKFNFVLFISANIDGHYAHT